MTLSCSSTDFENDSDFRPSRARCCLRFRLCRSIRCVYRLLITCSFPFRRDSYSGQPSVIHITTSKVTAGLRRPSRQCVHRIRAQQPPSGACHTRKQPALARLPDASSHCSSISAQTMTSLPGCMREVTDCGLSFLNGGKSC